VLLRRRGLYTPLPGWPRFFLRLLPALAALAAVLAVAGQHLDWIALGVHPGLRAAWLAGVLALAVLAYFSALFLFGFRPKDFTRRRA
jgi:putative peptidoglycan lipid II flippase